jgi:hypothetical protein
MRAGARGMTLSEGGHAGEDASLGQALFKGGHKGRLPPKQMRAAGHV